jgi:dolichol-phosphate mannosyltransferase
VSSGLDLSIVVPTYNESLSLEDLCKAISEVMRQTSLTYEIVIVDDNSPDGTADRARELARDYPLQVLQRPGKLGLSSAVIDGWKISRGEVLAVTDADLSHDPTVFPSMVASLREGQADVAVGSRYVPGGGFGNWPLHRQIVSRTAVLMGSLICPVRDVTSGFVALKRSVIEDVRLNPIGFKIGLELLVRGRYQTFCEIPYTFQDREKGSSKLGWKEIRNYLVQLGQLVLHSLRHRQPRRRVAPVLVSVAGVRR